MMRHFTRATSTIVTLALLLAVVVGPAQAHQARPRQSRAVSVSADDADNAERSGRRHPTEQADDTALVCLALVGGAALLAGVVWMRNLRWLLP